MAMNYAKAYQKFIDEELVLSSVTEWMAAHAGQVRFGGGRDIEIATLTTTGLGDYNKNDTDGSAYPQGSVSNVWTSHTLAMDRGVKFALDRTDPSDTGFVATAENVIREFARVQLTREQDTYRINKLHKLAQAGPYAATHVLTETLTSQNALAKLTGLLQTVQDDAEQLSGFVAFVCNTLKSSFLESATGDFNNIQFDQSVEINGIRYDGVMIVNDLPCLFVPGARMQTEVRARSGRASEAEGGIAVDASSEQIGVLIVSCDAPLAVSKVDSLKQFAPRDNQLFDGTAIQARYLYDLFVPHNKIATIGSIVLA